MSVKIVDSFGMEMALTARKTTNEIRSHFGTKIAEADLTIRGICALILRL